MSLLGLRSKPRSKPEWNKLKATPYMLLSLGWFLSRLKIYPEIGSDIFHGMWMHFHWITRYYIPCDKTIHDHRLENTKFYFHALFVPQITNLQIWCFSIQWQHFFLINEKFLLGTSVIGPLLKTASEWSIVKNLMVGTCSTSGWDDIKLFKLPNMKERYLMAKYGQVLHVISKWKRRLMFEKDLTVAA
jgi:hypothetical protein